MKKIGFGTLLGANLVDLERLYVWLLPGESLPIRKLKTNGYKFEMCRRIRREENRIEGLPLAQRHDLPIRP